MSFKDNVHFQDGVSVGLDPNPTPPVHACTGCGAETKEHHPILDDDGEIMARRRICAKPDCRKVIDLN